MEALNWFELGVMQNLRDAIGSDVLDTVMICITLLAEYGIFLIAVALIFIITKRYRRTGLMLGAALLCGVIICNLIIKNLVARTRPYLLDPTIYHLAPWQEYLTDYSFPSGHTLACFEMVGVLMITERKRFGWWSLLLGAAVGFTRIYLGVHYPTDVLGGAVLGLVCGFLGWLIGGRLYDYLAVLLPKFMKVKKE